MKDFCSERKIYYHHTSSSGTVYHASYLELLEEARVEFLCAQGTDVSEYMRRGITFPVVHCEVTYRALARYGDVLRITTRLADIGNTSLRFEQEIMRADTLLVTAVTVWVCIGPKGVPVSVPASIRQIAGR